MQAATSTDEGPGCDGEPPTLMRAIRPLIIIRNLFDAQGEVRLHKDVRCDPTHLDGSASSLPREEMASPSAFQKRVTCVYRARAMPIAQERSINACIEYPGEGWFCGAACGEDSDCQSTTYAKRRCRALVRRLRNVSLRTTYAPAHHSLWRWLNRPFVA